MIDEEKMKEILENHESRIKHLESQLTSKVVQQSKVEKKQSMAEFLLEKNPKSDNQKTLAIGYFLENINEMKVFTTKDLEDGFGQAKEKVPKNLSDTIYQNISQGNMMEVKEKKDKLRTLTLTASGTRFVENKFKKQDGK